MNSNVWTAARRGLGLLMVAGALAANVGLHGPSPAQATRMIGIGADPTSVRRILDHHSLKARSGETFSLESLRGEVVVINFWASWCKPCRRELPALQTLHADLSRNGGRVLAVSIDIDERNVDRFVQRHHLTLPVVHDGPDGLARKLDLAHIPFTIVIDREGTVAYTSSGASEGSLEALVAAAHALAESQPYVTRVTEGPAR